MSDPQNGGNGLSVGVTAPGGWAGWVKGRDTVIVVALLTGIVGVVYTTREGFARLEAAALEQRTGREVAVASIIGDHRELLCLLATPEAERKLAIRHDKGVCAWVLGTLPQGGPR